MKKALIAMSGGVDSSVAALLMQQKGYECVGATMKLFENEQAGVKREKTCCSLDDVEDARSVAYRLHMPYYVFNFTANFEKEVMDRFVHAYENGWTPNPCIDCNRYLKFEKLYLRMHVLPKRILDGIIEMIYALDKIAPGTANADTLLYGVEVKFYNMEVSIDENLETRHKGLYIIGKTFDLASLEDVDAGYNVEEWKCENEPNGIICLEDSIMISDKASDAIIQMDYSGNLIKKIGKTGNGEGEFLSPGAIKEYNHEIYVLDQGNNRVQIFDEQLNYVDKVDLINKKINDPDYVPQKMAVNEEGIYVTGMSLKEAVIDKYSNGDEEEIGANFIGSIASYQSEIYGINSMVRFYDKKNDSFGAVTTAPEWLLSVSGNKLKKVSELPYGFGITDFLIEDKKIICISGSGASVYSLGWNGEYKETLAIISGLENEENPQIDENNQGEYFIVMPKAKKIYRIYKK